MMIATDIDGTIKPFGKPIPRANHEAIRRFVDGGGLFTVVTGRSIGAVLPAIRELELTGPMLVNNGSTAYNYATGEILFTTDLSPSVYGVIADWMERFPAAGIEVYHDRYLDILRQTALTDQRLRRFDINAMIYRYATMETCYRPWQKALACAPEALSDEIEAYAARTLPSDLLFTRSSPEYCELVPAGASKGDGVKRLASLYGISEDRIFTAGDYNNDLDLLAMGAISFAPEDALEAAKAVASIITLPCEQGILPEMLNIIDRLYHT